MLTMNTSRLVSIAVVVLCVIAVIYFVVARSPDTVRPGQTPPHALDQTSGGQAPAVPKPAAPAPATPPPAAPTPPAAQPPAAQPPAAQPPAGQTP
jgi:DNA polymerase-3 subunit gamma/tau